MLGLARSSLQAGTLVYEVLPELANLTVENVTEACAGARQGDRLARRRLGYRCRRWLAGRG